MKWQNKGNELSECGRRICKIFDTHKNITAFGAGKIGSRLCRTLKAYNIFAGYVDNDEKNKMKALKEKMYLLRSVC